MFRGRSKWIVVFAFILILSIPAIHPIYAATVIEGFDVFHTVPFSHDFGPGIGVVQLQGRPIGPGNTDTIVQRMGGLPAGGTGTIDVEIVALSLVSVNPIKIVGQGDSFFDVFVEINKVGSPMLNPQPLPPSGGQIMITSHDDDAGGGKFDSFFDVFFDTIIVPAGGDPNGPNAIHMPGHLRLDNQGADWSHTAPPNYPTDPAFPSDGFFPGPIPHHGIHPVLPAEVPPVTGTPVGGEILPIDMTALFVAGAMTNAFWVLPTLGGITGAVVALFKIKRKHC